MKKDFVIDALDMTLMARKPKPGAIHHSDRGSQYCSKLFQEKLNAHSIKLSMSHKGNCWDNAVDESFFGTLKRDHVYRCHYKTKAEARSNIFEYIEVFYNRIRTHSRLEYLSPISCEEHAYVA